MPLINATWRVTLAGVVLLDWDDYMNEEPKLDRSFIADRVAVLGGAEVVRFGRQNLAHNASFSRVHVFESDWDARDFMRSHTQELPTAPDYCAIEWVNQFVITTLDGCVIATYNARCENNFFIADYSLQGGALVEFP